MPSPENLPRYYYFVLEVGSDNEISASFEMDGRSEKVGQEKINLQSPLLEKSLDYLVDRLNVGALDSENDNGEGLKLLGEILYAGLFPGKIAGLFEKAVQQVKDRNSSQGSNNSRLCVWISVDARSSASRWPLEFLNSGDCADWLATGIGTFTLSRNIAFATSSYTLPSHSPPLKILIVASRPKDLKGVMTKSIEDISRWATPKQDVDIRILGQLEDFEKPPGAPDSGVASFTNLRKYNESFKPDILHFIGHGRLKGDDPQLAFVSDDDEKNADWCESAALRFLIREQTPSLLVLQACETAAPSTGPGFMSLASSLLKVNVPAIVAMQFEVRNETAIEFSKAFYGALAEGQEISEAVQQGRSSITRNIRRWREREFGAPVLFMLRPNIPAPQAIIQPAAAGLTAGRRSERQAGVATTAVSSTAKSEEPKFDIQEIMLMKEKLSKLEAQVSANYKTNPASGVIDLQKQGVQNAPLTLPDFTLAASGASSGK